MANNIVEKAKEYITDFKDHWNVPYKGRYIPNKEVVAYGIGGMGVYLATTLVGATGLSASNLVVGSTIGLRPTHLYYMSIISSIFGILVTLVRSYIMDNIKSEMGKFRPFLKWMGIPTVILSIIFVWLPYEYMTYSQKAISVLIIVSLINVVNPFYTDSYNLLIRVMSPDSDERTDVMSISQIIFSLCPTIVNFAIPFMAQITGGLTDIRTYRYIYPIITILGLFMAKPVYKYTNERIIKPKSKENEVRFFDAIRAIVKNKYFWIINIAAWAGFLEMSYGSIMSWTFVYANPDKEYMLGVATTIVSNGALWAMIAAPFLIRKFGKRNLLIGCNCLNIVLLSILLFTYHNIFAVIAVFYVNNFVLVLGNIYNPGIDADMKDYQQYISGERIDGMFGVVGLIGTFIGYFTGLVMPYLQESCGLKDDYDVLYQASVRDDIFKTMIIASVVGATLNVIPYFFYDLTEKKHRAITYVLRIRNMFDDYSADCLDDEVFLQGMEIIENIRNAENATPKAINKDDLKLAKAMPKSTPEEKEARKKAIKSAKDDIYNQKIMNENIEIAPFVLDELNKFDTVRYQKQLSTAEYISANADSPLEVILEGVKDMLLFCPKDEKVVVSDLKKLISELNRSIRIKNKYYPDGVIEYDEKILDDAQNMETNSFSDTIKRKIAVRKAIKVRSNYKHAIKPIVDAKKLVIQKSAYDSMDELMSRYHEMINNNISA